MSTPPGKRDVVRLRTFADDVEHVQQTNGVSAAEASAALRDQPEKKSGVFIKVQKKSLDLTEADKTTGAIDDAGVAFDAETTNRVVDQSYEEHKAVTVPTAPQTPPDTPQTKTPQQYDFSIGTPAPIATEAQAAIAEQQHETVDQIVDTRTTAKALETSIAATESGADITEGEFVSDKKRERFKLMPAIGQAVTDWFEETKDTIEEAQREKHTVTDAAKRVDTIKAAAQAKTLAPDEDFSEVAKRLQASRKAPAAEPIIGIKPKRVETPTWTHTIGEETTAPTQETAEKATAAEPALHQAEPVAVPAAAETPAPAPVVTPAPVVPAPTLTPVAAEPAPIPAPPRPTAPIAPQSAGRGVAMPYQPSPLPSEREWLPSPLLAIGVVVLSVVAGVGTSLYFFWQPEPAGIAIPEATTSPLFTAELQTNVDVSDSHDETMRTLLSATQSQSGTLYMYLTRNNGQTILSPSEVMSVVAPQVPGSFSRSIQNISFGAYGNQPFMIMKVSNFDNAFAGMIAWEQTMSADLAPLFGQAVTESFDPQARTNTQTREAFFRDVVASNLTGRLLTDARGEDRILYTFVDRQTILITTDRLQLSSILPLVR